MNRTAAVDEYHSAPATSKNLLLMEEENNTEKTFISDISLSTAPPIIPEEGEKSPEIIMMMSSSSKSTTTQPSSSSSSDSTKLPMTPRNLFSLENNDKPKHQQARQTHHQKKMKSLVLMVNELLKYAGEKDKQDFANGVTYYDEGSIDERLKEIYQLEQQRKITSQDKTTTTTLAAIDSAIDQVVSSTTEYDDEDNEDDTTTPPQEVSPSEDKKEEDEADAEVREEVVVDDMEIVKGEGRSKRRSSGNGNGRRRSSSTSIQKKNKQKKKATRDTLIDLITKELANCWTGPDDATAVELLEAEISAEDIFYAQMNGEEIDIDNDPATRRSTTTTTIRPSGSSAVMKRIETFDACLSPTTSSSSIAEYYEAEFSDHTSFSGLELPDVLVAEDSGEFTTSSGNSNRSSSENGAISRSSTVKIKDMIMKHMMEANEPSASSMTECDDDDCLEISSRTKRAWLGMFDDMLNVVDKTPRPPRRYDSVNYDDGHGRCEEKEEGPSGGPSPFEDTPAEDDHDDDYNSDGDGEADGVVSGNVSVISDITDSTPFLAVNPEAAAEKKSSKINLLQEARRRREGEPERKVPTKRASANTASTSSMSAHSEQQELRGQQSRRKVIFSSVEVRYYDRVLEINPAVTSGASVGIGWRYKKGGIISINDWQHGDEEVTGGDQLRRRATYGLVMPKPYRESLLREWGYTQQDIANATRIIRRIKHNRKLTVQQLPNQHMEEAVENAARKVKNLLKSFGGGVGVGMNNKKR